MANYLFTDKAGTARRRASEITLRFPANGVPTVTFTEEDRIILADGKQVITPVDAKRVIDIDETFMQKTFPNRDVESGEVTTGSCTGAEIYEKVFSSISDVYIQTGIEADAPLNEPQAASSSD